MFWPLNSDILNKDKMYKYIQYLKLIPVAISCNLTEAEKVVSAMILAGSVFIFFHYSVISVCLVVFILF